MQFRIFGFYTHEDGSISNETEMTDIVADWNIDETVGDQNFVQAGDVSLKHFSTLKTGQVIGPPIRHWLTIQASSVFGQDVYNVYAVPDNGYDELNHKTGIYSSRLKSIQSLFYEDLATAEINAVGTTASDWGSSLDNSIVSIENIRVKNSNGAYSTTLNRGGFSLADMVKQLSGKHGDRHYRINTVNMTNIPDLNNDNLPVIFRGTGYDTGLNTAAEIVDYTFYKDDATGDPRRVYWKAIFEKIVFAFNSFIAARGSIEDLGGGNYRLNLGLDIKPKINISASGAVGKDFSELNFIREKFRLDGVTLKGKNFEYVQGLEKGGNRLERSIEIADPDVEVEAFDENLYWSVGDYSNTTQAGYPQYNVLDGIGENRPYFKSGLVQPFYSGMIGGAAGYNGKFDFNMERPLDHILINLNGQTIQINRVQIGVDFLAQVEGILI